MLVEAPEIPALPELANMGDLASGYIDLMELYGELRLRHNALASYVREVLRTGTSDGKAP